MWKRVKACGAPTADGNATPSSSISSNKEDINSGIGHDIERARVNTYVDKHQDLIKRGDPSGLMNLPVEIFMEIASRVGLGDLLFLAWTCKNVRSVLMRRSAEGVWRATQSGVRGLPKCPSSVDLPAYAALVFTKLCTSCYDATSAEVDPFLLVRLCASCCKSSEARSCVHWRGQSQHLQLVPVSHVFEFKAGDAPRLGEGCRTDGYCLAEHGRNALRRLEEFEAANDEDELAHWRTEMNNRVKEYRDFGEKLNRFLVDRSGPHAWDKYKDSAPDNKCMHQ